MSPICRFIDIKFYDFLKKKRNDEVAKKWAHGISVIISIVLLILAILLIIMLIIPQLITSISGFIERSPEYIANLRVFINNISHYININLPNSYRQNLENYVTMLTQYLSNNILPSFSSILNNFSNYVINFARSVFNILIGFIVAVYCLDKRESFALQAKKILFAFIPANYAVNVIDRVHQANNLFLGFLIGKLIDSFIIGIICFLGVSILRIPYSVLISVIIGVTNIIPFFGPFLGAIPCTIIILLESPLKALYFLIFIFVLQQFDGNILGPKILGDRTGVTSFWVLFSILLFGGLWGITGMIIAVPLIGVIYNLIKDFVNNHLEKRGLPTEAYYYKDPEKIEEKEEEYNKKENE